MERSFFIRFVLRHAANAPTLLMSESDAKKIANDWAAWKQGALPECPFATVFAGDGWAVNTADIIAVYAFPPDLDAEKRQTDLLKMQRELMAELKRERESGK